MTVASPARASSVAADEGCAVSGLDLFLSQRALGLMLVYAAVLGFAMGGVYDAFRLLRLLLGDPTAATRGAQSVGLAHPHRLRHSIPRFVCDLLFTVIAAIALVLLLYYTNDGQLRAPATIGMACGFFVYSHTLSHLTTLCLSALLRLGERRKRRRDRRKAERQKGSKPPKGCIKERSTPCPTDPSTKTTQPETAS